MSDLGDMVRTVCGETTAFVGVGNPDRRDDGAGIALVKLLEAEGIGSVFTAGTSPERLLPALREGGFSVIVFCDAVDAGLEPGSVILMEARDIIARYPQVSTHKISLGTVAGLLRGENGPEVYLLGIQPETIEMQPDAALSTAVEHTLNLLVARIGEAMPAVHRNPSGGRQLHVA
jgi:hydrogenase maturation protease